MADSNLVTYERLDSYKHYGERNPEDIDTITIHCYVGQVTAERGVDYLYETERQASVNYVCGINGIGEMIPENKGAWTSSSESNDRRALTIETACDVDYPYSVRDDVLQRVIDLCTDFARRHNKTEMVWIEDKDAALAFNPAPHQLRMTCHRWFAATACPGDYLFSKLAYIASQVTENLKSGSEVEEPVESGEEIQYTEYTHEDFIRVIAEAVNELKGKYNVCVASPIIAQAINESGWGKSNKAHYNNYFGLKYREGRLNCHCGTFVDGSSEEYTPGVYTPITDSWYAFKTLKAGVEGYFQFTNIERYANLKGIMDPYEYIKLIKEDGYATSSSYIANLTSLIEKYDLTKYDNEEVEPVKPTVEGTLYRVRTSWEAGFDGQKGAYHNLEYAKKCCDENVGTGVYDEAGHEIYSNRPASKPSYDIEDLANRVIRGEFGNGDDRRNKLEGMESGLYAKVQARVNEKLLGTPNVPNKPKYDIDDLARRVIRGEFGNGQERKDKLEGMESGLYAKVQARVNEMLS